MSVKQTWLQLKHMFWLARFWMTCQGTRNNDFEHDIYFKHSFKLQLSTTTLNLGVLHAHFFNWLNCPTVWRYRRLYTTVTLSRHDSRGVPTKCGPTSLTSVSRTLLSFEKFENQLTRSAACLLAMGHASLISLTGNPSNIRPAKSTSGWFFVANVWNTSCSTTKKNIFSYFFSKISLEKNTHLFVEIFERNLEYQQYHKYNLTFPLSYLLRLLLVDSETVLKFSVRKIFQKLPPKIYPKIPDPNFLKLTGKTSCSSSIWSNIFPTVFTFATFSALFS